MFRVSIFSTVSWSLKLVIFFYQKENKGFLLFTFIVRSSYQQRRVGSQLFSGLHHHSSRTFHCHSALHHVSLNCENHSWCDSPTTVAYHCQYVRSGKHSQRSHHQCRKSTQCQISETCRTTVPQSHQQLRPDESKPAILHKLMIDNNCHIGCQLSLQYVQYYIQDNINVLHDTNEMLNADHGPHGSAGTVLTATWFSYGKWQNSTPHRIKTPQLIDMKLWMHDYVRDMFPYQLV